MGSRHSTRQSSSHRSLLRLQHVFPEPTWEADHHSYFGEHRHALVELSVLPAINKNKNNRDSRRVIVDEYTQQEITMCLEVGSGESGQSEIPLSTEDQSGQHYRSPQTEGPFRAEDQTYCSGQHFNSSIINTVSKNYPSTGVQSSGGGLSNKVTFPEGLRSFDSFRSLSKDYNQLFVSESTSQLCDTEGYDENTTSQLWEIEEYERDDENTTSHLWETKDYDELCVPQITSQIYETGDCHKMTENRTQSSARHHHHHHSGREHGLQFGDDIGHYCDGKQTSPITEYDVFCTAVEGKHTSCFSFHPPDMESEWDCANFTENIPRTQCLCGTEKTPSTQCSSCIHNTTPTQCLRSCTDNTSPTPCLSGDCVDVDSIQVPCELCVGIDRAWSARDATHPVPAIPRPTAQDTTHQSPRKPRPAVEDASHSVPRLPRPTTQDTTHQAPTRPRPAIQDASHPVPRLPRPAAQGITHPVSTIPRPNAQDATHSVSEIPRPASQDITYPAPTTSSKPAVQADKLTSSCATLSHKKKRKSRLRDDPGWIPNPLDSDSDVDEIEDPDIFNNGIKTSWQMSGVPVHNVANSPQPQKSERRRCYSEPSPGTQLTQEEATPSLPPATSMENVGSLNSGNSTRSLRQSSDTKSTSLWGMFKLPWTRHKPAPSEEQTQSLQDEDDIDQNLAWLTSEAEEMDSRTSREEDSSSPEDSDADEDTMTEEHHSQIMHARSAASSKTETQQRAKAITDAQSRRQRLADDSESPLTIWERELDVDWLCEPEWNNLELELFWTVLRPHLQLLLLEDSDAGLLPDPCLDVCCLKKDTAAHPDMLDRCLMHVQRHMWKGNYRQAVSDFLASRCEIRACRKYVVINSSDRDDIEVLRIIFQRKQPARLRLWI